MLLKTLKAEILNAVTRQASTITVTIAGSLGFSGQKKKLVSNPRHLHRRHRPSQRNYPSRRWRNCHHFPRPSHRLVRNHLPHCGWFRNPRRWSGKIPPLLNLIRHQMLVFYWARMYLLLHLLVLVIPGHRRFAEIHSPMFSWSIQRQVHQIRSAPRFLMEPVPGEISWRTMENKIGFHSPRKVNLARIARLDRRSVVSTMIASIKNSNSSWSDATQYISIHPCKRMTNLVTWGIRNVIQKIQRLRIAVEKKSNKSNTASIWTYRMMHNCTPSNISATIWLKEI